MGRKRVNRGGSWNNNARNCRSANRNRNNPGNRNNNLGFRLVLAEAQQDVRSTPDDQDTVQPALAICHWGEDEETFGAGSC